MTQGINFGGDGPLMQGTWYNPNTGDSFTVRDSFFEDNQYIVLTTDGRTLYYNQLQSYIQSDLKPDELKKIKESKNQTKNNVDELPESVKGLIDTNYDNDEYLIPEDNIYTGKGLGNINEPRHIEPAYAHTNATIGNINTTTNMNTAIIEKALKNASKPNFVVSVNWIDYPERQLEMLKDVMDIPEDEILDWYLDNIDMLEIVNAVKDGIRQRIVFKEGTIVEPTPADTTAENPTIVEEKPIITVEKPTVVKKPVVKNPTAKKVTTTTKNAVKKTTKKK
jgi:hypothetical protein